ncbi:MAG: MerC domain-containing protein, partial [Pseudomonadales bacterium]|nr:MerC domain-containing protein [Pseudomonadales bacterium]
PIMLTLFPILQGSLLEEAYFHVVMLFVVLPTSFVALTIGCRRHKDILTIAMGITGLSVLTATALFGHDWFGLGVERIMTTLGGVILAAGHIRNWLCCRREDCRH